jgi:hypothetical protein
MPVTFPEPSSTSDLRGLMLQYLDYYRSVIAGKLDGLERRDLHRSTVPSGWTPAGLINHLANVERRWLRWGFMAEPVLDPWRDQDGAGWLTPDMSVDELISMLERTGSRTRAIVEAYELTDTAQIGGRFADVNSAPQLQWILLHLIQEYARHSGHLDMSRELIDGTVGEES